MQEVCWDFPLLGTGNQSGNNIAAITMFKGSGIMDGLAREVCQNSLDAKDKALASDIPVKVKFELIEIEKSKFDIFKGYEAAVDSSIVYWNNSPLNNPKIMEFLQNIKKAISSERIPMLVMSDYNTVGLNGVNAHAGEKSFWDLLVNVEGISIKQDDTSAGSFGIGKNAPFAYSALNLVLYNTLAKDGGRGFEGVARLVTTQKTYKGEMRPTQPIGKYLYLEDEYTGRPILPSDNCAISKIDVFNRKEVGTDVAVVGFKEYEYPEWEKNIAVAVIKNFILAIMDGKMIVEVKSSDVDYNISKDTLHDYLFKSFANEEQLKYTRQIYETITKVEPKKVTIAEKDDLNIYIRYDDNYNISTSRFRANGMLINTTSDGLPHFSVVIVVNDVGNLELSKTLREAEPPQHTEWKAKNITDNLQLRQKASRYLRRIKKAIQDALDEFDKADIMDKMDAGVGNYLPDSVDDNGESDGTDGLRTDIRINEISSNEGYVYYNRQYESGESSHGAKTDTHAIKTGKKKRKRKQHQPINQVDPAKPTKIPGVSTGSGKIRIISPNIIEHRIFYMAGNKYQLYVNSAADYEHVYLRFNAGRDDEGNDSVIIKNIKQETTPRLDCNTERVGPLSLKKGVNKIFVEFENHEIMALIPEFTMEVGHGQ